MLTKLTLCPPYNVPYCYNDLLVPSCEVFRSQKSQPPVFEYVTQTLLEQICLVWEGGREGEREEGRDRGRGMREGSREGDEGGKEGEREVKSEEGRGGERNGKREEVPYNIALNSPHLTIQDALMGSQCKNWSHIIQWTLRKCPD